MSKHRFSNVDYLKTIAIFLVVLGHFLPPGSIIRNAIYLVHIPIFFVIAGFLFNRDHSWRTTITKLLKRVFIPYFLTYVLSMLLQFFMKDIDTQTLLDFTYYRGQISLWNSVLWFFPVYFCATILFKLLSQIFKKWLPIPLIMILIIISSQFNSPVLAIFGINKVLLAVLYFGLGFYLRRLEKIYKPSSFQCIAAFLLTFTVMAFFGFYTKGTIISINQDSIGTPIIFIILSSTLCALSFIFTSRLPANKFMQLVSSHTIFIMCTRLFFRLILSRAFNDTSILYRLAGVPIFMIEVLCVYILSTYNVPLQKLKTLLKI